MTTFSSSTPSFDFWEFVTCGICHLPFIPQPGAPAPAPFWLTECGHVVCNNHLTADQSCAQCGMQAIQVARLQVDMDPLLSGMFSQISHTLDSAANAAKFQLDTLANLVRHYKNKCIQQRGLLEKFKNQYTESKRINKQLEAENQHLRELSARGGLHESRNVNGKRPQGFMHGPGSNVPSSPRSVSRTAERLTLPPEQKRPRVDRSDLPAGSFAHSFTERRRPDGGARMSRDTQVTTPGPGTSAFAQQFAYMPPETPQLPPQAVISHQQGASARMQQQRRNFEPPPPSASANMFQAPRPKFKPANVGASSRAQSVQQPIPGSQLHMPPPPPQYTAQVGETRPLAARTAASPWVAAPTPSRPRGSFAPQLREQHSWAVPATPSKPVSTRGSFIPATPGQGPQRFLGPALLARPPQAQSAQRRPFQPGQGGFG